MRISLAVFFALYMVFAIGCSGGSPTTPVGSSESQPIPDSQEFQVMASGTMNLEDGTLVETRTAEGYFNVTGYVGSYFSYTINGWLEPGVLDLTLNLQNPTALLVHDVYVVFEELLGKEVLNADGMIDIYSPGDLDPFRDG